VASAASGQMVATTPSRVMNSRRLMADPVDDHKLPHCATQQNWLSMSEMGQNPKLPHRNTDARFTSISRPQQDGFNATLKTGLMQRSKITATRSLGRQARAALVEFQVQAPSRS
jgi:hypothetical protein